ncbi:hypothetical protein T439DRAFT_346657 [Meredithblackwellia eburnea MCA 4105]
MTTYSAGGGGPASSAAYASRLPHAPSPIGLPQFNGAPPVPAANVPPGTLAPGTIVRVGAVTVQVDRFLSEGGFAHVYLATSETPIPAGSPNATTKHVLKRMAVPDKKGVQEVGKEVEVMRKLKSHPRIVNFIEASVSELTGPTKGYEIYILMEWCAGGGIIDMMNTRLQNRLTESEILKIFSDTVEAVAHMHYQSPPLIHRDLKVENILLTPPNTFKLCDFGSTTVPLTRVPTAVNEIQALEADINKTTTLQYRAPELVDVWSRKGYDEKIDIWALGVLLYKLCYYTTPFEEHGPLAILNAQYKIPPYPAYSNAIKGLISGMLQERASQRPNIYQVHEQVCRLRGTSVKIDNIYAKAPARSQSQASSKPLPQPAEASGSAYSSIISSASPPPGATGPSLADTISPMRRGRPSKATTSATLEPAPAADNRMVRTGLASLGDSSDSKTKSWENVSGWPSGSAPVSAVPTSSALTGNGFGDSFSSMGGATASFGESFKSLTPSPPPISASSSPVPRPTTAAAASLFSDLVGPNKQGSSGGPASRNGTGTVGGFDGWKAGKSSPSIPSKLSAGSTTDLPKLDKESSFVPNYNLLNLPSSSSKSPPPVSFSSSTLDTTSFSTSTSSFGSLSQSPKPVIDDGPPLPRRPPGNNPTSVQAPSPQLPTKPELINRASQTSPHLMASWKAPLATSASSGLKEVSLRSRSTPSPVMPSLDGKKTFSPGGATLPTRPPVIDLLGDDDDFQPPMLSASPSSSLASAPNKLTNNNRLSLVGGGSDFNFEEARAKFRPTKPSESSILSSSTVSSIGRGVSPALASSSTYGTGRKASDDASDVTNRFPSLDDLDAMSPPPATSLSNNSAKIPKSKEEDTWQPIVERDVDSSDEDDFAPKVIPKLSPSLPQISTAPIPPAKASKPPALSQYSSKSEPSPASASSQSSSLPPINRVMSPEEEGDIDLGPALASIRRFAPKGNDNVKLPLPSDDWSPPSSPQPPSSSSPPPIQAPKPRGHAGITGLVSRYETLSVEQPQLSFEKKKPVPGAKPERLRKDSMESSTSGVSSGHARKTSVSSSWAQSKAEVDGFNQRFPDSSGLDSLLSASASSQPMSPPPISAKPKVLSQAPVAVTPPVMAPRVPFKPTPPALSPTMSTSRSSNVLATSASATSGEEEEEEKFIGVSNMRSRWEGIGRAGTSTSSTGPGKPAVRKEWGVV